ncbi:MAG: histidine phosphatase family protein [Promethearchaeota archaeon]
MELTLIRHGETPWNLVDKIQGQADIPLSESGIHQAQTLHDQMQALLSNYTAIYTSPMKRALKTAQVLRGSNQIPLIIEERLKSRNLGDFSGQTLDEISRRTPKIYALWRSGNPKFCPPNGESTRETLDKLGAFLTTLSTTHPPNSKIIIVTHRESVGILMHLLGKDTTDALTGIANCVPYRFSFN